MALATPSSWRAACISWAACGGVIVGRWDVLRLAACGQRRVSCACSVAHSPLSRETWVTLLERFLYPAVALVAIVLMLVVASPTYLSLFMGVVVVGWCFVCFAGGW